MTPNKQDCIVNLAVTEYYNSFKLVTVSYGKFKGDWKVRTYVQFINGEEQGLLGVQGRLGITWECRVANAVVASYSTKKQRKRRETATH